MTIELYFSNQLDQLADRFSDVVTDEVRGKDNILEPPVMIVPNAKAPRREDYLATLGNVRYVR